MRVGMTLAVINILAWGAVIAFSPGTHFAWPGSYRFWWFDDVPWASLTAVTIALVMLAIWHFRRNDEHKSGIAILLVITLAAILPYEAFSGGGV